MTEPPHDRHGWLLSEMADLADVYVQARQRYADDPDFRRRASAATRELRAKNPYARLLWLRLTIPSLMHLQTVYRRLNVALDARDEIAARLDEMRQLLDHFHQHPEELKAAQTALDA